MSFADDVFEHPPQHVPFGIYIEAVTLNLPNSGL